MNQPADIATLIAYHAAGFRVPPSFEVRCHQWRVEAQARFNERGLPLRTTVDGFDL
jgi:hypothetical protein